MLRLAERLPQLYIISILEITEILFLSFWNIYIMDNLNVSSFHPFFKLMAGKFYKSCNILLHN